MSTDELKVLGVAGSMRAGSYSTRALKIALENAKNHSATTRLLELREANIPMYSPGSDAELGQVAESVVWADAFILATPDYHGSMSGALKNFLDHFYEEFAGKVFGYVVASHERGLTVMDQMRTAVRQCYGWSLPYGVSINGEQDFVRGLDPRVEKRIKMMGRDLVVYGRLVRGQFLHDLKGDEPDTFAARYR